MTIRTKNWAGLEPEISESLKALSGLKRQISKEQTRYSPTEQPFEYDTAANMLGSIKVLQGYDPSQLDDPQQRALLHVAVSWLDSVGKDRFDIPSAHRNTQMMRFYDSKTDRKVLTGLEAISNKVKEAEHVAEATNAISHEDYAEMILIAAQHMRVGPKQTR